MVRSTLDLLITFDEIARLEAALSAVDSLTGGTPPTAAMLAAAPLLTDWRPIVVPRPEPALTGRAQDHPLLRGPRTVVTSRVLVLDAAAGWARTVSRLYRLGPPGQ